MRFRRPIVLLVAAAAALGLSACGDTNVGVAARVDNRSITESTVDSYLTKAGPSSATVSQAAQSGTTVQPKTVALQFLLSEQVYEAALRRTRGGVPSEEALTALHDEAAQRLLQAQVGGDALDAALRKQLVAFGLSPSLLDVIVRQAELADAYINRKHISSQAALNASVAALRIPVSVNPRYGSWRPATQQLNSTPSAGLPSYLHAAASPSAAAGQ